MNSQKNRAKTQVSVKNLIDSIKQDKDTCKTSIFYASLLINIFLITLIVLAKSFIPPEIPLFYGLPEGEEQLASKWLLIVPALLTIIFTITNFVICKKTSNNFVKQISNYILIPINFFSTIAIIKIILLVGSF